MVKRIRRSDDGKYHIKGRQYTELEGSRAQVWHRNSFRTSGGLTHDDLLFNKKTGRVVSKKKHKTAKRERKLAKLGYKPVRGKPFVPMRKKKTRRRR